MNFIRLITFVITAFFLSSSAQASWNQIDITNANNGESVTKNATDHGKKFGSGKCVFNPSATSASRAVAAHGCGLTIPKNAIVTRAVYKVVTTFTSADDSATLAIKIVGANDVVSAAAISSGTTWDAAGPILGIPVTATAATWLTTTVDSEVTFTVAVQALTAGKLVLWVEWFYFGDI